MDWCFQTSQTPCPRLVVCSSTQVKWRHKQHQCNLLSLNKRLMTDRKGNNIAVFPVSYKACSVTARVSVSVWIQSVNQSFSKLVSQSVLLVCLFVCVVYRLIPISRTRISIQSSTWVARIVLFSSWAFPADTGHSVQLVRCLPVSPAWQTGCSQSSLTTTKS